MIRQIDDFENMLKKIITKSLNFSSKSMKKKRQEHIEQTKENPLMKWKVQEYESHTSRHLHK